jgi:hypothetical protein
MIKILFSSILMLSSFVVAGTLQPASANSVSVLTEPQVRIQIGRQQRRRYRNRDFRPYGERVGYGQVFTRDVQRGRYIYRETYRVRQTPYGGTQTVLISRVRLN